MELHTLKCPNCDGSLEIEDGIDTFFCKYCGQKIILEGQSSETIKAKVKVKGFQHVENLQKSHYQHRENLQKSKDDLAKYKIDAKAESEKRNDRSIIISFGIMIFAGILVPGIMLMSSSCGDRRIERELKNVENHVIECINKGDYDEALVYANKLRADSDFSGADTWDKKREEYISLINSKINEKVDAVDVEIPFPSKYVKGKKYEDIVKMLKDAGFTNISLSSLEDDAIIFTKTDKIEKITVNGKSAFEEGEIFKSNVKIIVYYYK